MRRVSDSRAVDDTGAGVKPGWYHEFARRHDIYFRRSAHLFLGLRYYKHDSYLIRFRVATDPSVCQRVRVGAVLEFAGLAPPLDRCTWCLRIGRRLGLVDPDAY